MAKISEQRRKELLEHYGKKKRKETLPTYLELQSRLLERHPNVKGNCGICKMTVGGVEKPQPYPCASLQRLGVK